MVASFRGQPLAINSVGLMPLYFDVADKNQPRWGWRSPTDFQCETARVRERCISARPALGGFVVLLGGPV